MDKVFLSLYLLFFIFVGSVFADNNLTILEPVNNSEISDTSPKLSWQYTGNCPTDSSCFRVELDDAENFSSVDKSTYTNNTYYTPQNLSVKPWYWRVKAKNTSGEWSDWATGKFTIKETANPSSPSPPNSPSSPQPSPTTQNKQTSVFNISNTPSETNSNQEFNVTVEIESSNNPDTVLYLKGAFTKSGSTNYFGKTKVGGEWIKNSETASRQLQIKTDSSGKWKGNLTVIADTEDSGFDGSGNYIFKAGKYNSSGSGLSWSNETNIKINYIEENKEETKKSNSTLTSPTPLTSSNLSKSLVKNTLASESAEFGEVAGESTHSYTLKLGEKIPDESFDSASDKEKERIASQQKVNWFFIVGGILSLIVGSALLVYRFRNK